MNNKIPELYRSLISDLEGSASLEIFENQKVIQISNFLCEEQTIYDSLIELINTIHDAEIGQCTLIGDISQDFDLNKLNLSLIRRETLTLVIDKSTDDGFYFFSLKGLTEAFKDEEFVAEAKVVRIAEDFTSFYSISTLFCPWEEDNSFVEFGWKGLIDPRKLVRDLSIDSNICVPNDIRPWLLRPDQKNEDTRVFNTWRIIAAKKLIYTLPCELTCNNEGNKVTFKGEKLRYVEIIELQEDRYLDLFDILHRCSEWVYSNLQEAETKHSLLNYQIAFEWIGEEKWPDKPILERSLISAREAFKLHLQKSSKDLLKIFSEIKKSLHEEVSKVSDNTRNLVTNLWRDFSIAAAVLVIKFITGSKNITEVGITILYTATSLFLLTSFIITMIINARFNKITRDNRKNWQDKLYPFLDKNRLDELVNKPISKGITIYRWVASFIFIIYLVMIFFLLNTAYSFV